MRRNFYSFQSSEQTVVGIPGLFLVIQVQGPPGQRGERSEQIWACCCFQIGWSNGWLLGICRGCRLTLELSGPQEERLEAKGHRPVAREWPLTPTTTWWQRPKVMLLDNGCVVAYVHCCSIYLFNQKAKTVNGLAFTFTFFKAYKQEQWEVDHHQRATNHHSVNLKRSEMEQTYKKFKSPYHSSMEKLCGWEWKSEK